MLIAQPPRLDDLDLRRIEHGFVAQQRDSVPSTQPGKLPESWESVGKRPLSADLLIDLRFGWIIAAHSKSNAIVIVRR